jgi:hypothetical protein
MYWKMSIDLTRPIVPSMGQHDPLDGLVTYRELQLAAPEGPGQLSERPLEKEIADLTGICNGIRLDTEDPLGIGGLLSDASRIIRLTTLGGPGYAGLLENLFDSVIVGLDTFVGSGSLGLPAEYRLAFRELGLSTGLAGGGIMKEWIENVPDLYGRKGSLRQHMATLLEYAPLRETIEQFWLETKNRESGTWTGHRDINTVMLATSLAPEGFLGI